MPHNPYRDSGSNLGFSSSTSLPLCYDSSNPNSKSTKSQACRYISVIFALLVLCIVLSSSNDVFSLNENGIETSTHTTKLADRISNINHDNANYNDKNDNNNKLASTTPPHTTTPPRTTTPPHTQKPTKQPEMPKNRPATSIPTQEPTIPKNAVDKLDSAGGERDNEEMQDTVNEEGDKEEKEVQEEQVL